MSATLTRPADTTHAVAGSPVQGTGSTIGAARIADAFGRARSANRAALIPYIVAGYPDAAGSLAAAVTGPRSATASPACCTAPTRTSSRTPTGR